MSFTNYLENAVLNQWFGGVAPNVPDTIYIGLSSANPDEDGGGISEPSANGYTRAGVANDKSTWTESNDGTLSNATAITFPESTGSWGTLTHIFVADAETGGNILAYGTLRTERTVVEGDTLSLGDNAFVISLD